MRKIHIPFLVVFSASTFFVLLFCAGMNCYVNPGGRFGSFGVEEDGVRSVAEMLLQGQNVLNVSNINDRKLHAFYVEGLKRPPDVILFGSSRSLPFGARDFPGGTFFNHSIPRATLFDFMTIWQWYLNRGFSPAKVVFCLDPWIVSGDVFPYGKFQHQQDYAKMAQRLGVDPVFPGAEENRFIPWSRDLFSLTVLKKSVHPFHGRNIYVSTSSETGELSIKRADGSFGYPRFIRDRTVAEVRILATERLHPPYMLDLERSHGPDTVPTERLEKFLVYLKSRRTEIVFCLIPYHPIAFKTISSSGPYSSVQSTETYYRRLAAQYDIPVFGSYDPVKIGCLENEFDDGVHPRIFCLEKALHFQERGRGESIDSVRSIDQKKPGGSNGQGLVYLKGHHDRRPMAAR